MSPGDYPMVLSVNHVAEIMGIGRSKAYEIMQNPKFPVLREGRKLIIPRDSFFRWLDPDYIRDGNVPTTLLQGNEISTMGDHITEICTQAIGHALNDGTISLKELVNWAMRSRIRQ